MPNTYISLPAVALAEGASTSTLQTIANISLSSIDLKLTGPINITGPLTDIQLRALPLPVSGVFFQPTQPVSLALVPLPIGASTSALQISGNSSLTSIDTKTPTLIGGRQPVDGSGVTQPISGSISINNFPSPQAVIGTFFQSIQPVSLASVPIPAGASTSALQTTGNVSLSSIDSKTPTLVAGRQPVDGSAVTQPISALSLPLPTGAATAANQVLNVTAIQTNLTIATVPIPIRVGAANLIGRRMLLFQANAAGYSYGYTVGSQPFLMNNGTPIQLFLGDAITVWVVKTSGTNTVTVAELS